MAARDGADWQSRYEQSLDGEEQVRDVERPTGFRGFLIDFDLWSGAVVLPIELLALGLGWIAERIGWSRWGDVIAAAAAAIVVLALVLVKRRKGR